MASGTRILLLFDNVGQEYTGRLRDGVNAAMRSSQHSLHAVNLYGGNRTAADVIGEDDFAGVILTSPTCDDRTVLSLLEKKQIPFVRIACMLDLHRGHIVSMDEYDAARAITAHLIDHGHTRIGFIRGARGHLVSIRRFNGYASAIGMLRQKVDPALTVEGDFSRESGKEQAANLFAAKPTAIFASNDEMAIGAIQAAEKAGLSVPGDVSIVGFDDNKAAQTCRPPLTSVRQPLEAMGETAFGLIAKAVANSSMPFASEAVPFKIIERASVKTL